MTKLLSWQQSPRLASGIVIASCMFGLLVFPSESMQAARDGLSLCYNVIIPSLFPFFVLSSLVIELGLAHYLGRAAERIMRPLFNVGGACAAAFILGVIGGYPVGARTAIQLYEKKMCSKAEAERLLSFCNNSGPAFILGVVGAGIFSSSRMGLLLYFAHVAASVCIGILFRFYRPDCPAGERRSVVRFQTTHFPGALTSSIKNSFLSALNICAFVVFFLVVIRLLFLSGILSGLAVILGVLFSPFGFDAEWARRLLTGIIEISSGVWTLNGVVGDETGRLSMAAFMLGWAGLSVHCQVLSFIGGSGLSMRTYIGGKILHGILSALFIWCISQVLAFTAPVTSYLAEEVESLADMRFGSTLFLSVLVAWAVWAAFILISALVLQKNCRKRGRGVV